MLLKRTHVVTSLSFKCTPRGNNKVMLTNDEPKLCKQNPSMKNEEIIKGIFGFVKYRGSLCEKDNTKVVHG
jgi:hypothetical protein